MFSIHGPVESRLDSCVRALINVELSRKPGTDGFDHVELRSSVVVTVARKGLEQRLIQRNDGHIDDEDLTELLEAALEPITLVVEVLNHAIEDLSKELTECRREPVMKGGIAERTTVGIDVLLPKFFEGSVVGREKTDR